MSTQQPVLVTGAAGFIGFHVAQALLARGERVLGIDNLNDYYDPRLKEARLALLARAPGFGFRRADIADHEAMLPIAEGADAPDRIVHLAAQAGVRYSLVNPYAYVTANVMGQVVMQELARRLPGLRHFVYASSSSVYGGNSKLPFSVEDRTDTPVSLYAATKKADELIAHAYAHLYAIPSTGLRFFTVYGPWGRPDMAAYLFASAMTEGREITVYNNGEMRRDFTYIDDIVAGVLAVLDRPPPCPNSGAPARVYNIGNNRSEPLMRYIGLLEEALGVRARIRFAPKLAADVVATFADIEAIRADAGFAPTTPIDVGVPRFVAWFKDFHSVS
ncbi:MAG: NAD-dependent epimerase/dehydratase family protein [Acetobacteraceae bacterium]|nr:NAD-dependent epimerase/dehydratase family protein [Acetobacteraceae bacterium]